MATIQSLAPETLIKIFEDLDQLLIPGIWDGTRPSLCSCALVCRGEDDDDDCRDAEALSDYFSGSSTKFPVKAVTFQTCKLSQAVPLIAQFPLLARIEIIIDCEKDPGRHLDAALAALGSIEHRAVHDLSIALGEYSPSPGKWECIDWLERLQIFLEQSSLPNLRHLGVPFAPRTTFQHEVGVRLLKLCKERDIAVIPGGGDYMFVEQIFCLRGTFG
ncbi:hypothetical protein RQP46_006125 [Phenoliferia psychrophenolica]